MLDCYGLLLYCCATAYIAAPCHRVADVEPHEADAMPRQQMVQLGLVRCVELIEADDVHVYEHLRHGIGGGIQNVGDPVVPLERVRSVQTQVPLGNFQGRTAGCRSTGTAGRRSTGGCCGAVRRHVGELGKLGGRDGGWGRKSRYVYIYRYIDI